MLKGKNDKITMTEGDYGIVLPIKINGAIINNDDILKFTVKENSNKEEIFTKDFKIEQDNTLNFILTEEESKKFPPAVYVYSLDWYREGNFLCNLVKKALFEVEDKI